MRPKENNAQMSCAETPRICEVAEATERYLVFTLFKWTLHSIWYASNSDFAFWNYLDFFFFFAICKWSNLCVREAHWSGKPTVTCLYRVLEFNERWRLQEPGVIWATSRSLTPSGCQWETVESLQKGEIYDQVYVLARLPCCNEQDRS
jgi:hypothetical protein